MGLVKITATKDISNEYIDAFVRDIGDEKCASSGSRISLCSADPPSFIQIIGTFVNWQTVFGISATVFLSTLSKKLAEDLYEQKQVIASTLFEPFRRVGKAIANFIDRTEMRSKVMVEIVAPKGISNPSISFRTEPEPQIVFELSCFYAASEKIVEQLIQISSGEEGGTTSPMVSVSTSGDVTVRCYRGVTNELVEFTIDVKNDPN